MIPYPVVLAIGFAIVIAIALLVPWDDEDAG